MTLIELSDLMVDMSGLNSAAETYALEASIFLALGGIICCLFGHRMLAWIVGLSIGGVVGLTIFGIVSTMESAPVAGDEVLGISIVIGLIAGAIVFRFTKRIHMLVGGLVGLLVTMMGLTVLEPYYPTTMIMKAIIADIGFLLGARMLRSQSNIISYLASSGAGAIGVMMGSSVLLGSSSNPLMVDLTSNVNRTILFVAAAAGTYFQIYWLTREGVEDELDY